MTISRLSATASSCSTVPPAPICTCANLIDRRLRRPPVRGLSGDSQRHPARRHRRSARQLLRRRLRCRRDEQLRRVLDRPQRVPDPGAGLRVVERGGAHRPRGGRLATTTTDSWPARSAPARRWSRSTGSASPSCATPTRRPPAACSTAASTCSSSRRCRTCCRRRPR